MKPPARRSRKPRRRVESDTLAMQVSHLATDPLSNLPILILKDARGEESLPIFIGLVEAGAIAARLDEIRLERPMTHDLMATLLGVCGGALERVLITELRGQSFHAVLCLRRKGARALKVEARASDAIALALRTGAEIHVARKVLDRCRARDVEALGTPPLGDLLESLSDEEFGKWKM